MFLRLTLHRMHPRVEKTLADNIYVLVESTANLLSEQPIFMNDQDLRLVSEEPKAKQVKHHA